MGPNQIKEQGAYHRACAPPETTQAILADMLTEIAFQLAEANESLKKIANPLLGIDALGPGKITIREPYATLRDQLAMSALSGLLADPSSSGPKGSAQAAYEYADAMLEARKK